MATKSQKTTEDAPEYTISGNGKRTIISFGYLSDITSQLDCLQHDELTMLDIFRITAWKIDRYPQIDENTLKKLNELRSLKKFNGEKTKEVLDALLGTNGVGLPMASTYLRFVNPKVYQIIDVRAYRAAFNYKLQDKLPTTNHTKAIDNYLHYITQLQKFADKKGEGYHGLYVDFEHMDRFLYDIDKKAGFKVEDTYPYSNEQLDKWKRIIKEYGGEYRDK